MPSTPPQIAWLARVGRVTTAQQALDRFHDEHSAIGRVRRRVADEDDGRALRDRDPYADRDDE